MDLNRRQFFFLGAGAFAARALGSYNVYTTGIPNETVLKVKPLEINLGIGKAFKAFHFSDTHLNFFDAVDFAAWTKRSRSISRAGGAGSRRRSSHSTHRSTMPANTG